MSKNVEKLVSHEIVVQKILNKNNMSGPRLVNDQCLGVALTAQLAPLVCDNLMCWAVFVRTHLVQASRAPHCDDEYLLSAPHIRAFVINTPVISVDQ